MLVNGLRFGEALFPGAFGLSEAQLAEPYSGRMRTGAETDAPEEMTAWRWRAACGLVTVVLLILAAVQDWYGPTDSGDLLGSDAVQYLDCARAFDRGDWHAALNGVWNQGYPALLAGVRVMFPEGMARDWWATRALDLGIFCFAMGSFAYLLAGISARRRDGVFWLCGAAVLATVELCVGHVSRVGPDELIAACFLLACGLMLRLVRGGGLGLAVGLGVVLGCGFLVKSVFLPLGLLMLAVLLMARRRRLWEVVPAAVVFGAVVLGYGLMLSHAVGYRTLGESGGLNYAWRVNRLTKWVHWGGRSPSAAEAWPSPWMARFARWETHPPDFGRPVHAEERIGMRPTVFVFHEPVRATYVPYYDLAYWYQGYRHLFVWRYQVLAFGRSVMDLLRMMVVQPMFYALAGAAWMLRWRMRRDLWPLVACCAGLVVIYLPVYEDPRYLTGAFAVGAMVLLGGVDAAERRMRGAVLGLILLGAGLELAQTQRVAWSRAMHGWQYRDNVQWRVAQDVAASGLGKGAEVGMISWTPNLECDWAYLAEVRITSEIADGRDETTFWAMSREKQAEVLERFRAAGATAVLSWEGPPGGADAGWGQLPGTPMWMYRFEERPARAAITP